MEKQIYGLGAEHNTQRSCSEGSRSSYYLILSFLISFPCVEAVLQACKLFTDFLFTKPMQFSETTPNVKSSKEFHSFPHTDDETCLSDKVCQSRRK